MSWFSSIFKRKARTVKRRRVISPATLHTLLRHALEGLRGPNCVIRLSDRQYASVTRDEVQTQARRVWKPWVEEIADCDDQALSVMLACREMAFSEGMVPFAVGYLATAGEEAHAYTWCLLHDERDGTLQIAFYDQTEGVWASADTMDRPVTLVFG